MPLATLDVSDLALRYQHVHADDPDSIREAIVRGTDAQGHTIERPLKEFFTTEVREPNGDVWVHEEGSWFVIEPHHRATVRLSVDNTSRSSLAIIRQWGIDLIDFLPDTHADEAAYNLALSEANDHLGAVFLDEPAGRIDYHGSTVELGDVFFPQQRLLLHVKHETSFGPVSKVCDQAGRAAELIAADPDFRERAELFLTGKCGREVSLMNNRQFTWGVAIILDRRRVFPACLKYRAEECLHDYVHKISASGNLPMIVSIGR